MQNLHKDELLTAGLSVQLTQIKNMQHDISEYFPS